MTSSEKPVIWRYILASDAGLAPHIADRICSLAVCKPKIREHAQKGEWIIGIKAGTARSPDPRIAYVMKVDAIMSFEGYCKKYFRARRDAFYDYSPGSNGKWIDNGLGDHHPSEYPDCERKDKGGKKVLLSTHFAHFGEQGRTLNDIFWPCDPLEVDEFMIKTQGQKKFCQKPMFDAFNKWVALAATSEMWRDLSESPAHHQKVGDSNRLSRCR